LRDTNGPLLPFIYKAELANDSEWNSVSNEENDDDISLMDSTPPEESNQQNNTTPMEIDDQDIKSDNPKNLFPRTTEVDGCTTSVQVILNTTGGLNKERNVIDNCELAFESCNAKVPIDEVDIAKLCILLEKSKEATSCIEGKDVILLLGTTGSGKTTSLLYLAGVKFEKNDDDEFCPCLHKTNALSDFAISDSSRSCTRHVQAVEIELGGCNMALCDTPGFGDTEGVEYEIANGHGIVQAVQRAKRIFPVVVLNKSCVDGRFQMLNATLDTISRITGNTVNNDYSSFIFLFTDCTERDCAKILKKLVKLKAEIDEYELHQMQTLSGLVNAMVLYISKNALYIDLSTQYTVVLKKLLNAAQQNVSPSFFRPFVSRQAEEKLCRKIQGVAIGIEQDYIDKKYEKVEDGIDIIHRFGTAFSDFASLLSSSFDLDNIYLRMEKHCLKTCHHVCLLKEKQKVEFREQLKYLTKEVNLVHKLGLICFHKSEINENTGVCIANISQLLTIEPKSFETLHLEEVAWNLYQLLEFKKQFIGFEGEEMIERAYHNSFARVNHLLHSHLKDIDKIASKEAEDMASPLMTVFEIATFFKKIQANGVAETLQDHITFDVELASVKTTLHSIVDRHCAALSNGIKELKEITGQEDISSFCASMLLRLGKNRATLLRMARPKSIFEIVFGSNMSDLEREIDAFDAGLVKSLDCLVLRMEGSLDDIKTRMYEKEFSDVQQTALLLKEKLNIILSFFEYSRQWIDFNCVQVDKTWKKTVLLQESVEQFLKMVDEEFIRVGLQLEQAIETSSSFLQRLLVKGVKGEKVSSIIQELDQHRYWPLWVEITSEISSLQDRFVRWISGKNAKLKTLKSNMEEILLALSNRFLALCCNLDRNIDRCKDDISKLVGILASSGVLVELLSPLNLTFQSNILHEIFRNKVADQWVKSLLKYSNCLNSTMSKLKSLCVERNFKTVKNIFNTWSVHIETWELVVSFACLPAPFAASSRQSEALKKIQESLLNFPGYKDSVAFLFESIDKMMQEIDNFSWSCICDSSTHHERLEYCHSIASLMASSQKTEWIGQYAIIDTKFAVDNIETYVLSKISDKTKLLNARLDSISKSFPREESNFESINACLSTLTCIATVFNEINPTLQQQAKDGFCQSKRTSKDLLSCYNGYDEGNDVEDLVKALLLLKQASYKIPCWCDQIDAHISALLTKEISNNVPLLIKVSSLLQNVPECNKIIAQKLLFEHAIFEGIKNAAFNTSTKQQSISYVLKEATNLSNDNKLFLEGLFGTYDKQYNSLIEQALPLLGNEVSLESFYQVMCSKTNQLLEDSSLTYGHQICNLTAYIFAYWAISGSRSYFDVSGELLRKPHPAQIIGVWIMLNVIHQDSICLDNVLVQLSTWEGKSIVLGVTATILALLGCNVDCICYSKYLSNRDYEDFIHIFELFGVTESIRYGNIQSLADSMLKTYWMSAESIVLGKSLRSGDTSTMLDERPRILLVDEVDVFFGEEVLGESFRPRGKIAAGSLKMKKMFHHIWSLCSDKSLADVLSRFPNVFEGDTIIDDVKNDFPTKCHKIIERLALDLLIAAHYVKQETPQYVVQNGRLFNKYFDGLDNRNIGALNSFRYIREWEKGNVSATEMERNFCLCPLFGEISLAEIPHHYEKIIGVSGTLEVLGNTALEFLKDKYNVSKFVSLPSVYGSNKLRFAGDRPEGKDSCCKGFSSCCKC
jgi:energy-coupling factor transporter ATP-binding protein EcfA2